MVTLEDIFNAIFDAEENYGAEYVSVAINNKKLFVMYNNNAVNTFDYDENIDIKKVNELCNYLSLKFIGE